MDWNLHHFRHRARIWISSRIPALPAGTPFFSQFRTLTWLAATLPFGLWAHSLAKKEALQEWQVAHPPSAQIWDHALGSAGLSHIDGTEEVQRRLRALPLRGDPALSVWAEPEGPTLVIFTADREEPARLYSPPHFRNPGPGKQPQKWALLGNGWEGLNQALKFLQDRTKPTSEALSKPRPMGRTKRGLRKDPREILY